MGGAGFGWRPQRTRTHGANTSNAYAMDGHSALDGIRMVAVCALVLCGTLVRVRVCVWGGRYILRYLTHDTRLCVTVLVARSGTPKTPVALKSSAAQTHTHTWCSFWRQAAAKMVNNILGLKTSKPEAIVFACVCQRNKQTQDSKTPLCISLAHSHAQRDNDNKTNVCGKGIPVRCFAADACGHS